MPLTGLGSEAGSMPRTHRLRARVGLALATLLCLLVGAYGLALAASGFGSLADDIAANGLLIALEVHIVTASAALVLVPWQLWPALRARVPRLHRWTGRTYVLAAMLGGASGFAAAIGTTYGPAAAGGFGVLGLLWTWTTVAAYRAARRRDLIAHRRWAIRSFALAFAAVTLRLYLPLSGILGVPFEVAYPVVAWLCWIPNLWLAERALRRLGPGSGPRADAGCGTPQRTAITTRSLPGRAAGL